MSNTLRTFRITPGPVPVMLVDVLPQLVHQRTLVARPVLVCPLL